MEQIIKDELAKDLLDLIRSVTGTAEPLDTKAGRLQAMSENMASQIFVSDLVDKIEDSISGN